MEIIFINMSRNFIFHNIDINIFMLVQRFYQRAYE